VAGWNGWASLGGQLASGGVRVVRNGDGRLTTGSVVASSDAGASWSPLGSAAIGSVADLPLSQDEGTLFAATSSGVWRMFV
jgi:hypothetical protein